MTQIITKASTGRGKYRKCKHRLTKPTAPTLAPKVEQVSLTRKKIAPTLDQIVMVERRRERNKRREQDRKRAYEHAYVMRELREFLYPDGKKQDLPQVKVSTEWI